MKNKNGFTLIELLAVLVILGVIGTIIYPIVSDILSDVEEKAYNQQINAIKRAAKNYASDNSSILIEINENDEIQNKSCYVKLSSLKSGGYLENEDTIDPRDDNNINDAVVDLEYDFANNQYNYTVNISGTSSLEECGAATE